MLGSNLIKIAISQVFVVISFGIGYFALQEGEDGKLYLKIEDKHNLVCAYSDNNSHLPENMEYGAYYGSCVEGAYHFEFALCDGGGWKGRYHLVAEKGTNAGILSGPVDGRSRWYILNLTDKNNSIFNSDTKSIDTVLVQDGVEFHVEATYFSDLQVRKNKAWRMN